MNSNTDISALASGKGHRDENFPVASIFVRAPYRPAILAFYRFARAADDIVDNPSAGADEKLHFLEQFRASIEDESDTAPLAVSLREILRERNLTTQHAKDLLEAFRRDVTTNRYSDWTALMDYCRYSAIPVGRFVLDLHGESRDTWPANDALCAALQVINHLQDCGKDFRDLNRVYLPMDVLTTAGVDVSALNAPIASPALRQVISDLTKRTMALLDISRAFAGQIHETRLALEVSVIQKLAEDLCQKLLHKDPLSQPVHHNKIELIPLLLRATAYFFATRLSRRPTPFTAIGGSR